MNKYFILLFLLINTLSVSATGLYDQLCAFNPNWKKYPGWVANEDVNNIRNDQEYIRTHLTHVLRVLNHSTPDYEGTALYQRRITLIQLLNDYRLAGRFPLNDARHERIPVFIDRNFTHCAVAYLLQQTGHEDLALRIAGDDNYAWVKDIRTDGLLQWQQSSGLTVEELKLIQGAYDFYDPIGYQQPNKYEIPQQPVCTTLYFETTKAQRRAGVQNPVWCRGEGEQGVLNGKWEQNYGIGLPWIIGYYKKGKRTGQWFEYFPGTTKLCRTEYWDNDKLNGTRTRFDMEGKIIEEITFNDGEAITKTNYDRADSLKWVRMPLDSTRVNTWVYHLNGKLIAYGAESVYNPGNLRWFQNIELTALNSAAITARNAIETNGKYGPYFSKARGFSPPLVEYKKEGMWTYLRDEDPKLANYKGSFQLGQVLRIQFRHLGTPIYYQLSKFTAFKPVNGYTLLKVNYINDAIQDFRGYGADVYTHLKVSYYENENHILPVTLNLLNRFIYSGQPRPVIRSIGEMDQYNRCTGNWHYYNKEGELYKTEYFIIPQKEEQEETGFVKNRRKN